MSDGVGADRVEKVTLVLVGIPRAQQHRAAAVAGYSCVMPRGDPGRALFLAELQKYLEFDLAITEHVRIRRASRAVFDEKMSEYPVPVLAREVDSMQFNAEVIADPQGVKQ